MTVMMIGDGIDEVDREPSIHDDALMKLSVMLLCSNDGVSFLIAFLFINMQ